MDGTPKAEGGGEAAAPPSSAHGKALKPGWQITFGIGEMVAAVLIPLAIVWIGGKINDSVARTQVGPEYVELALETIAQDPLAQPAGVREWAVEVLQANSPAPLTDDLVRRLEAGWSFEVPVRHIGEITVDTRSDKPEVQTLDGHDFEVNAVELERDGVTAVGASVSLVLPDGRRVTEEASNLSSVNILRLHHGSRAYLFRLEGLDGPLVDFTVWKQSPGFREPDPRLTAVDALVAQEAPAE